jgi:hypothetical protein
MIKLSATIAIAIMLVIAAAPVAFSQTQEQCAILAPAADTLDSQLTPLQINLEKMSGALDNAMNFSSGNVRSAMRDAKAANDDFSASLMRFRTTLRQLAFQAQICAGNARASDSAPTTSEQKQKFWISPR